MMNVFKPKAEGANADLLRDKIVAMAQQLGTGQFGSQLCPECEGGKSHDRSLSMLVEANGIVKFHCHRAACGFQGQAYAMPGLPPHRDTPQAAPVSHLNPFNGDIHPLSDRELAFFAKKFNLDNDVASQHIFRTSNRYAMPIYAPDGSKRGWTTRKAWPDSPAYDPTDTGPKTLTYQEVEGPMLSWYRNVFNDPEYLGVFLVEDQLSAMRLWQYFHAVYGEQFDGHVAALMGTGLNIAKIAEIQRVACKSDVVLALDKDATGQAFAAARKWGSAFYKLKVVCLSKDIKDSTDAEIGAYPW